MPVRTREVSLGDMMDHGASQEEAYMDWSLSPVAGQERMSQIDEQSTSTFRRPASHHRNMTESLSRPLIPQPRLRSNTSTNDLPATRPLLKIETDGQERRPMSMSLHARTDSSSSLTQNLKSKASRLLRRQGSHGNLTSLHTIENTEEERDEAGASSSTSTSPKRAPRKLQRSPVSAGKLAHPGPALGLHELTL